jgi:CPA2 family monovalent cation:H+ antiporter-2
MELELLRNIVVVIGLSVAVLFIFHRIRAPTVVGFLITGVLAGPQGLGLIEASEQVKILAEIGVVLLLFTVGIEISLKDILRLKKYVLVGGFLQVSLTILAASLIAFSLGQPVGQAIMLGFLVSLSSTAIVLSIIQKQEEFDSLYGRTTLGVLIFQDIAVVPLMLMIPLLPGAAQSLSDPVAMIIAKALALVVLIIFSAKWVVPKVLYHIAKTKDRELFMLSIIAICFAVAWATSLAGLSLGLGAFLAGLIISESQYSHQAFGNVVPLRDAFTSIFFISIGMLLDVNLLIQNPLFIILLTLAAIVLKASIAGFAISVIGLPLRIIVMVSLALSQIGEFSFVLSKVGFDSGLISGDVYQIFLDVTVLTMAATSLVMAVSPRVADGMLRVPGLERLKARPHSTLAGEIAALEDHLIIVGYGVNGRNVARSAKVEGIPYLIVEMDPEIVRYEKKNYEHIYFGDASTETVLHHVGIKKAKVMVIAISDPAATRRITELSRRLNSDLFIIARTRYIQEMKPLHDLGADVVIPEEYETSVEIFSRVLNYYQVPREKIESFIAQIRADGYDMFRSLSNEPYCDASVSILAEEIRTLIVCPGSPAAGRTIYELQSESVGIKWLAVMRGSETLSNPQENLKLQEDDIIVLMGSEKEILKISNRFCGSFGQV